MPDPILAALITGAIALITGAIILLWTHRLSLARDRKNALREPIADFKSAFAEQSAAFREREVDFSALAAGFDKHRAAVDKIMPLLSDKDRAHLQQAWNEYSSITKGFEAQNKHLAISGYNHPDFLFQGRRRFAALTSCLDHLA